MYFYFVKEGALMSEHEIKNISIAPYHVANLLTNSEEFGIEFLFANTNRGGMFGKFSKDGAVEYLDWLVDQIGMGNAVVRVDLKLEGGRIW